MLCYHKLLAISVLLKQLTYSHCPIPPNHHHPSTLHKHTYMHTLSSLLQCMMENGKPQDTLTPQAQLLIKACGSHNRKVSRIVAENDPAVSAAIKEGLERANKCATSQQYWVCIPFNVQVELSSLLGMIKGWKSI